MKKAIKFISNNIILLYEIIGILFVIPLFLLLGSHSGILYSYFYTFYCLFGSIFLMSLPNGINKIINDYYILGYSKTSKKAFNLFLFFLFSICFIICLLMFIFSFDISSLILGNIIDVDEMNNVSLIIKISSIGFLIFPLYGTICGYLKAYKKENSIKKSIIIRILSIIILLIISIILKNKVLKDNYLYKAIYFIISVFISYVISLIYLIIIKIKNDKSYLTKKKTKEIKIKNKELLKKLLNASLNNIFIASFIFILNIIDSFTIIKTLNFDIGYSILESQKIYSVISLFGFKINQLLLLIAYILISKKIINLKESNIQKDNKNIDKIINNIYIKLITILMPLSIIFIVFSNLISNIFYGNNNLFSGVLQITLISNLFEIICLITLIITNILIKNKNIIKYILSGIIIKILLNGPLIHTFYKMGLPAYYGSSICNLIVFIVTTIICLVNIKEKYNLKIESTIKELINIIISSMIMTIILIVLKLIFKFNIVNRLVSLVLFIVLLFIGMIIHTYVLKLINKNN